MARGDGAGEGALGEQVWQGSEVRSEGLALYVAQRTDRPPGSFHDFIWAPETMVMGAWLPVGEDWPKR